MDIIDKLKVLRGIAKPGTQIAIACEEAIAELVTIRIYSAQLIRAIEAQGFLVDVDDKEVRVIWNGRNPQGKGRK